MKSNEKEGNYNWFQNFASGVLVFVVAILVMCSGVFLMLSGKASLIFISFVLFGSSAAMLTSMTTICEAMSDRAMNKMQPDASDENEITDEGVRQLDKMSRDCKRIEERVNAGV